jgi:hypothetical protein
MFLTLAPALFVVSGSSSFVICRAWASADSSAVPPGGDDFGNGNNVVDVADGANHLRTVQRHDVPSTSA